MEATDRTAVEPPSSRWAGLRGWAPGRVMPLAVGVAGGLLLAQIATAVFARVRWLIVIVVISLFLSFAVEPAVQWMARRGVRRGIGTWVVFGAALLLVAAFTAAMASLVIDQARTLAAAAPALLRELSELAQRLPGDLGPAFSDWLDDQRRELPALLAGADGPITRGAFGLGQTVLGGAFQLATIALVTFYLAADGPRLRFQLASRLEPRTQVRLLGLWELAIRKMGGYVYSRLLTAVVSAVFHIVVFTVIGLDYAVALGVWVGLISSLIPAIGTYLAGALPIVVALASSLTQTIWVLGAIVAYQQVENYWVVPRITAATLQLHPAVAFLSVLAGGALAGAPGALLAIPVVAVITALISAAAEEYDVLEHHLLETGPTAAAGLIDESHAAEPAPDASHAPHEPRADAEQAPGESRADAEQAPGESRADPPR